jgi:tRNA (Thr-GGU) A37 N-methylase
VLKGYPRGDERPLLTGVFCTRSPARPNPLGVHPVTEREIDPPSREGYGATSRTRVKIGPIEVFDGTPMVDIKSASTRATVDRRDCRTQLLRVDPLPALRLNRGDATG